MRFPIRSLCFLMMLAASLSGCAQNRESVIENKLVGRWQMDETDDLHMEMVGETMEDRAEELNLTGETVDTEGDFVAAKLEIEFAADGRLRTTHIMMNKPYEKTGTWKLAVADASDSNAGDTTESRMVVNCDLSSGKTDTEVTFVDDDTIRMIPPNFDVLGKEHTFKRAK